MWSTWKSDKYPRSVCHFEQFSFVLRDIWNQYINYTAIAMVGAPGQCELSSYTDRVSWRASKVTQVEDEV